MPPPVTLERLWRLFDLFHFHQMRHFCDHSANLQIIRLRDNLLVMSQSQGNQDPPLFLRLPESAPDLLDFQLFRCFFRHLSSSWFA